MMPILTLGMGLLAGTVLGYCLASNEPSPNDSFAAAAPSKQMDLPPEPEAAEPITKSRFVAKTRNSDEIDSLREEVQRLRKVEAKSKFLEVMIEGYREEIFGTIEPWPERTEKNEKYQPESFHSRMTDIIEKCDPTMEILKINCDEPPCLAVFRPASPGWHARLINNCPQWLQPFGKSINSSSFEIDCEDGHQERGLILSPSWQEFSNPKDKNKRENRRKRLKIRRKQFKSEWQCSSAP